MFASEAIVSFPCETLWQLPGLGPGTLQCDLHKYYFTGLVGMKATTFSGNAYVMRMRVMAWNKCAITSNSESSALPFVISLPLQK